MKIKQFPKFLFFCLCIKIPDLEIKFADYIVSQFTTKIRIYKIESTENKSISVEAENDQIFLSSNTSLFSTHHLLLCGSTRLRLQFHALSEFNVEEIDLSSYGQKILKQYILIHEEMALQLKICQELPCETGILDSTFYLN